LALRSVKQSLKLKNNSLLTSDKKRTSVSTEKRHSESEEQAPTWWVRDELGGRYGPVNFEVLKSWARDGRIGPAHKISKDGVEWSPATAEPDLEMAWVAEMEGGRFYGPIHRDAVQGLINDGAIARRSVLFRRAALDARDAEAECRRLTEALRQAQTHAQRQEELCRQAVQLAAAREAERVSFSKACDSRLSEAEALLVQAREGAEAALRQERAAREGAEEALRQERAAREGAEEALRQERAAREGAEAALRQERAACEEALGQARADLSAWADRFRQAAAELEHSRAEAREWQTRFQDAEARQNEQESQREEQGAAWQQQRQSMQQQLQVVEQAHQTVQRERDDWQAEAQRALAEAATRQQVIARLEAEADVFRKMTDERSARDAVIDAEVLPPVRPAEAQRLRPSPKPPAAAGVPGDFTGLSLTELERQAQRELERLGARGPAFFAKKR
jgi:chromosome segregation ATPase